MQLVERQGIDFELKGNFSALLRERGKIVPNSRREGHNVFTITGRNWLSKLISWQTIQGYPPGDVPFTHRRIRWIGVGVGSQFEVTTVTSLVTPTLITATDYLVSVDHILTEFPTSTSVRFYREFGATEISLVPGPPIIVSEAGLYVDVNRWDFDPGEGGTEDAQAPGELTTLDPQVGTNPPVAYKAFEGIPKTQAFTLEVRWEFRF